MDVASGETHTIDFETLGRYGVDEAPRALIRTYIDPVAPTTRGRGHGGSA